METTKLENRQKKSLFRYFHGVNFGDLSMAELLERSLEFPKRVVWRWQAEEDDYVKPKAR